MTNTKGKTGGWRRREGANKEEWIDAKNRPLKEQLLERHGTVDIVRYRISEGRGNAVQVTMSVGDHKKFE